MISMVQPMAIGNALKLHLTPPANAEYWRVLRKGTDDIVDEDDASAIVAYEGDHRLFVDTAFLTNEVRAYYTPFYRVAGAWVRGQGNYGTPTPTYEDYSTEVLGVVRDRLEAGLAIEVQRGNLMNELGYIQVLTAPPNVNMNIQFPLVTLSLETESRDLRGIGEDTMGDFLEAESDEWLEHEGWLASVQVAIIGWSLNPDERLELRKAIRRIIVGNLTVFADKGMSLPNLSLKNDDAVNGEYGETPMYLVTGFYTCIAPVRVGHLAGGTIQDIDVEAQ
ncbi:head-to-tail adaptor [Aeromonas phage ST4]|nr:head-to-tail adaptor [Aeromonas phage ST4]